MQILVVEDEPKIANLLRRGLMEESYAVDIALNGEDALHKFDVNEYDFVILDRMLPNTDGIEVCRKMRTLSANIPILILTAKGEVEDRIAGLDSGADDYMIKPFAFGELTARIRSLLRRGSVALPTVLTISDLTCNPATREVERGGKKIEFTAKEYALLEYFMRNQNKSLSKRQILEHVWDYSYEGFSNIVETYVKYLRKKLRVHKDSPELIYTHRGYGYSMKVVKK